ncbi:putative gustatory receptor 47b [Drosophila subpulchrella]|uniref:putative gustatory receptor 47b n=1 Tax=Drosophila subpulchrella TaxID=1486046 RepID=UPI0018A13206|nr:putative gustatory receptor 47b [Drosophila subpulchrella]
MQRDDGFVYCYGNMYSLLFYWGLVSIRVRSPSRGGAVSKRWTVAYALCARFFLVNCFLGSVLVKLRDPEMSSAMFGHLSPLVKAIFIWECLSCSITYVEYCLSLDSKRSRHLKLLASMQEFDGSVLEVFPYVKWNYLRSRLKYWYGTVIVGSCYFSFSISLIFDTARCTCGIPSTMVLALTYTLLTSSVGLVGFVHIGIMDFLRVRLRLVQQLLEQLYQADGNREVHEKIAFLFDMSKRCSFLLAELNGVFGFAAAAGLFYDFTIMTCFVYVICQKLLDREPWDLEYAFMLFHVAIHTYKVVITSTYGYLLQREKRNCMQMLSNYSRYFPGQDVAHRQTEDFQHWRMHNRQAALVGSTTELNVSTIYMVYNGMANYVIILVQLLFQQQQIKDRQLTSGKDVDIVGPMGPITHMD